MNRLLLSTGGLAVLLAAMTASAVAADLPARVGTPAPAPVPVYVPLSDWNGFYVGISGGYGFGESPFVPTGSLTGVKVPNNSVKHNGGIAGGQIGFNYQWPNRFVLGAVADLSWAGFKGNVCVDTTTSHCDGSAGDSYAKAKINWLATFRGNLGFAPTNDLLAYLTGGLAVAGFEGRITHILGASDSDATDKATRIGFAAGGGVKYKFARSWSLGAEYIYVNLGKHGYTFTSAAHPASEGFTADVKTHLNIIRGSLSYEFGGLNSTAAMR
jgi:outer membrane immunogenic protein